MRSATHIARLAEPGVIRIEFQPILRLVGDEVQLYSLEALARGPQGATLERAEVMFEYARRMGEEMLVDLLCIRAALAAARDLPGEPHLSLNVHGSTLSEATFAHELLAIAAAHGIAPRRLMLEIVEHRTAWPMDAFGATLQRLRNAGVRIALDDLGVAASNYRMLVDCRPDHLKVDRYVVHGCSLDRFRRAVLESIVTLAKGCAAVPIAEGVEEAADLLVLRSLGIEHFQGWLWARSMPAAEIAKSDVMRLAAAAHA
ncbi:MAG TPA: EAL domain-containing protein [Thermoanaerobaculia bacterium]|nr:EAL domain-containing protein [Thermoanaerobaculia bacterium]